jgi:putative ABC transport system substrate-binding protein
MKCELIATVRRLTFVLFDVLAISSILILNGCGDSRDPARNPASTSSGQKLVVSSQRTGKREQIRKATIALIRLNDPDSGKEPGLQSIEDGIKQTKRPYNQHSIVEYDAGGDLAAVPGLVEKAMIEGADVIVTLLDSTTMAALTNGPSKPIVFAMANDPFTLGLGKSVTDHLPNVTGAYLPHRLASTVEIARTTLPNATKLAVLYDPGNRLSAVHKDNLLKCDWAKVEAVPVAYGHDTDWAKLMDGLPAKGVAGLILTNGLGKLSPKVITEAARAKLPVWGTLEKQAEEGAILTSEPSMRWTGFEVGRKIGRIVNGDEVSEIPFVEGDQYSTVVNTKAAKDIGVTIPSGIMRDVKDVSTTDTVKAGD